jgi:hypothetical protein
VKVRLPEKKKTACAYCPLAVLDRIRHGTYDLFPQDGQSQLLNLAIFMARFLSDCGVNSVSRASLFPSFDGNLIRLAFRVLQAGRQRARGLRVVTSSPRPS